MLADEMNSRARQVVVRDAVCGRTTVLAASHGMVVSQCPD
jgi:hypothetical protein